jgi:ribosomal protein L37AE/L43A
MTTNYTREQRRALAEAARQGGPLQCPACGAELAQREITPRPDLPYVRRRVWLICPACQRSAVVER